ncbi:MAG: polymerase Rpb6 [Candidatus Krumholzibacteriota bacterium]|nr:polymerase Rpb6 [Candidatus Krumholzibacteriota bacterium]
MKNIVLIDRMTGVIPNKYEAVRVIAKEARRINALLVHGAQGEVDQKPTMMALSRLLDNRIKYKFLEGEPAKEPFEGEDE